jgi:flagellar biosynthesis GTPase FlhF
MPASWSLTAFARQTGVNREQIRAFAELEFITKAENIVLVGKTGVGKTGAGASAACQPVSRTAPAAATSVDPSISSGS